MPRLILKDSTFEPKVYPIEKEKVTIGRNSDNDIMLDNRLVSRYHAVIERMEKEYMVRDLSKNGTYVNGIVVKERLLKDQDIVRIGRNQFIYDTRKQEAVTISPESSLAILQQVGKAINRIVNREDLMNLVMDLIVKLIHVDRGMILLVDQTTRELVPILVRGREEEREMIVVSQTVIEHVMKQKLGLIITDTASDPRFKEQESIITQGINSIMSVPMLIRDQVIGIIQVDSKSGKRFVKEELDLLCYFSDYLAIGIEQARLNEQIKRRTKLITNLERFHSPEVMSMIISNLEKKEDIDLDVEEKEASILFVDICNFTPMSERLEPVEVAVLLNEFFSLITDIIFRHGGTLDKFIGDSVMALFGVPYAPTKHADRAVKAAKDMQNAMKGFVEKRKPGNRFEIRIGINTGKVVAGNIGSQKRMEYTVLGDTVNVASRLCGICEPGRILIGRETKKSLTVQFPMKDIGEIAVKGKEKKVFVFEVERS